MKELDNEAIREQIGFWMNTLFDKDIHVDIVKSHVQKLANEVAEAQLKNQPITDEKLSQLFKVVENATDDNTKETDN